MFGFSALQRAEIAEIANPRTPRPFVEEVSVLFNEPKLLKFWSGATDGDCEASFSALQRAEIAEMVRWERWRSMRKTVSVLFNEPKLLKLNVALDVQSAPYPFQCSSTSRNC